MYASLPTTAAGLQATLKEAIRSMPVDAEGKPTHDKSYQMPVALLIGDRLLVGSLTDDEARWLRGRESGRHLMTYPIHNPPCVL